jgi:hypothetical protein
MHRFAVVAASLAVLACGTTQSRAEASNPDAVAVIIGNQTYQNHDVPEVRFANRDAEAMKRYLIDVLGYSEQNIISLNNATENQLVSVFGSAGEPRGQLAHWLRRDGKSDVLVYYSGNSLPGGSNGQSFLLPADANLASPNGYPLSLLYANLAKIGAHSITVVLDAAFSGADAVPTQPGEMTVITASKADQLANWDIEHKHGLFTEYLLEALYGKADETQYGGHDDGRITLGAVQKYLDEEMSKAALREGGREQNATIIGDLDRVLATLPFASPPPRRDEAESAAAPAPVTAAPPAP